MYSPLDSATVNRVLLTVVEAMELVATKAQCTICARSTVYQELPCILDNPEIYTLIINQLLKLILVFF